MPNVWTHYLFGERIAEQSGMNFSLNKKEFQLGTQGPDPFFYYSFWPWKKKDFLVLEIGSRIHKEHCGEFLFSMIEYLKISPNAMLKAYVFGFISHHVLDRNAHPYIVYRSGEKGNKHQKLEIYIDTLMLKKYKNMDTWKNPVYKELYLGPKLPHPILEMLANLIRQIHKIDIDNLEQVIDRSYKDMITALKVLYDPTGIKNAILKELISSFSYTKNLPNKDFLNEKKNEWKHPAIPNEKSTESFIDIFNRAEKEGVLIFKTVQEYLQEKVQEDRVKKIIGNLSYETGKPCDSKLENVYFDPIL